jgi:hypothetical protein
MLLPMLALVFVCVALPLAFAWRLLRLDEPSLAGWLVVLAETLVFLALVWILGRWDIVGTYTRLALAATVATAIALSWHRHRRRPWRSADVPIWRRHWATLISLAAFSAVLVHVAGGLLRHDAARDLRFPLSGGRFIIGQGGDRLLLNHHAGHAAQGHALDISALNAIGLRAAGLLPADQERYAVYGASVISPCTGKVLAARDGLPDLAPPQRDRQNAAGNNLVIACDDLRVELAHLRAGSLTVAPGDSVVSGQPLATVGNSGNTTEPHLHIHAVDAETGKAVPIRFDGRTPVRNSEFERR